MKLEKLFLQYQTNTQDRPMQWLEQHIGFEVFKSSLSNLKNFLSHHQLLEIPSNKVISIVGTNGKGQVTRELSQQLRLAGKKVFRFTSPHFFFLRERLWFDGEFISEKELLSLFTQLNTLLHQDRVQLSFFEFLYAAFLLWIQKNPDFDFVLCEAGVGGRLDATKCLKADHVLLTSISRDHINILGNSLKQILLEKVGILYEGGTLIYNLTQSWSRPTLEEFAAKNKIQLCPNPLLSQAENYFERNNLLVRYCCEKFLSIPYQEQEATPLTSFQLQHQKIYFNPAHNLDGIRNLFQFLNGNSYNGPQNKDKKWDFILLAFSDRSEAELKSIMKVIESYPCLFRKIKVLVFDHPRALSLEKASRLFELHSVEKWNEFAWENLGTALLLGSNYCLKALAQSNYSA